MADTAPQDLRGHPLYGIWAGMMAGCYSRNSPQYPGCGSQGVTVFRPWHDPAVFIRDIGWLIGPRPAGRALGRVRANADYGPGTVRWTVPRDLAHSEPPAARLAPEAPRKRLPVAQTAPRAPRDGTRTGTLYSCWWRLARRCPDEVYPAWHDWHVFRADIGRLLGTRPEGYRFSRIDYRRPYGPGNVTWMTPAGQFRQAREARPGPPGRTPEHGMCGHPLYTTWKWLVKKFTGRLHPAWFDVRVFVKEIGATIGPRPAGKVFRLIDPDGDYAPGNVTWGRRGRPVRY